MLPKGFNLEWLNKGVKGLVLTINKIPGVHTATNCEGHVYRDCLIMPTKDGWVHFFKEKNEHEKLIKTIEDFCGAYPLFNLVYPNLLDFYTINGTFREFGEPFKNSSGVHFEKWKKNEQEEFFEKADVRKKEIENGWGELESRIKNYILENITKDLESLPYM